MCFHYYSTRFSKRKAKTQLNYVLTLSFARAKMQTKLNISKAWCERPLCSVGKRESGQNPEQPPLLYLTRRGHQPLGAYPEKASFRRRKARVVISQDTCRIRESGSTRFGVKSATGLSEKPALDGAYTVRSLCLRTDQTCCTP